MKIRTGFVSNSSSSSFIIYVSRKVFDLVYGTLTEVQKQVVDLSKGGEQEFMGVPVISYSYVTGSDGWLYDEIEGMGLSEEELLDGDEDDIDEDVENSSDALYEFATGGFESRLVEKAKELGESVLTHSEDC